MKNPTNNEILVHKVKALWEKWVSLAKDTWNVIVHKLIINKHKNIIIGVYWNGVSAPGWQVSGWSNVECMAEGKQKA